MPCIELAAGVAPLREQGNAPCLATLWRSALVLLLAGCGSAPPPSAAPPATGTSPAAVPAPTVTPPASTRPGAAGPSVQPAPVPAAGARPVLPPLRRASDWDDFRMMAAKRISAANPAATYDGVPPEPLLAIPVLEIELNADGSVRNIKVLRRPGQALDTIQLAIDAVHRAAPFGDVRHLPRPWRFAEVFLFNNQRQFKPRTLDL